ncbi:glycine/betaine ABC transporter [Lysinibacillus contaminans]|uniref:Glycine/betaine ABC transporter n=1 Tax=Lysinibacillus contaminans TaxID=1293441 RepID=A0ABR5K5K7_9BACI|nr:glycine betaine ABC transporter substrate-binding protein [Lysinibacillus contaminans]KOS71705.1 glycine/betaine ABC transporter [Lysinibacillus contaminans]
MKLKVLGTTLGLAALFLLTGCGDEENNQNNTNSTGDTASLGEQVDYKIVGIEPGAGLTELSQNTLKEYENLKGWELVDSSTAGMLGSLEQAIRNKEPIIITGWTPHWKFSEYDLKFLEDPKGTLGGSENINTIVRKGLENDLPGAYTILDRFYWEPKDMEAVMYEAQNSSFEDAAIKWIEENQDKVNEWTEGVDKVDGKEIELVSTPWDSERASSSVMKAVLEQLGYSVTITPVDPAIMFQAIATDAADATLAPWLPTTHSSFYEKHKEDIVDLGENLKGTKNGFVVPEYMEIDSIEDLQPKE